MSSYVNAASAACARAKCSSASSSMVPMRSSSLYAGTTTLSVTRASVDMSPAAFVALAAPLDA
eukprot:CAMPEP_0198361440 /NCGR_PEP_ID=MMETSP1450-20131203/142275_1 /TAXON_ID=753684 ORGANISM="Madagascaria erythrocladiodes, Strain CCMP3234" /NCGR_SAMPLE_ID=MMETSP1450 /ASSEMBLY_ACC=CAM_ASM_001115 /LENGTH=62 /DNA_ID=CAMNT_0044068553 /DNA_START=26 /DNA_END=210 /DNA_ORIENTATION=-